MLHLTAQQLIIATLPSIYYLDIDFVLRPLFLMDIDGIEKSRKRPGESDSTGNKRARLHGRNKNDRDRRRNKTEKEKKLRLAKIRERDRARRAASFEKNKAAEPMNNTIDFDVQI